VLITWRRNAATSTTAAVQPSAYYVHQQSGVNMAEVRTTTAIAVRVEPAKVWTTGSLQAITAGLRGLGAWATDTAQQFGALLAALMGPAVFSAYVFALWSLSDNLGWTGTFIFHNGPLSNWLIWLGFAILVNLAATILRRHTQPETEEVQ
jgi:hypothetical protein